MIEIKNLTKIYKSKKKLECKALDDINITLPDKGLVFIVGKSGSGKSTLLNMISGLDTITSGEIIADGNYVSKMNKTDFDKYLSTYIGFIFQDYRLIDDFTIKQNIELSLDISGKQGDISYYLKQVDLEGYENRYPRELSGGQKQRIAIVRALIKDPHIILADEPTGNLDAKTTTQVLQILKEISKEKLVLIVSHSLTDAYKYGDRIIELSDGKIINDKSRKENYKNEFSITDGILNLPHHYDLNEKEINQILENKKHITKINQINGGFHKTKIDLIPNKKIELESNRIAKDKKKQLFSIFFKRKLLSKIITAFLAALLISISYVMQSFGNFDENQSLYYDIVYNQENAIILRKAYYYGVSEIPTSTGVNLIKQDEIDKFKEVYKKGNIYKLYNYTISIEGGTIDYGSIPYSSTNTSLGYLIKESYGTLNCDEEFVKKVFYNGDDIEVICGDLYDKDYGMVITDYIADSIMSKHFDKYPTYESILGLYQSPKLYNHVYINAIIKTDYKEKYKDLLSKVEEAYKNVESADLSAIKNDDNYANFFDDVRKYYGISYNFSDNFKEAIDTYEDRTYVTLGRCQLGDDYNSASFVLSADKENKLELNDDEISMNYALYNKIYGTEYTSKTLKDFEPHKINYTLYSNILRNEILYEKEFTIKSIISSTTRVNNKIRNELAEFDVISYSLYFDNIKGNEKLLDVAKNLVFVLENNDIQGIAYVARSVSIIGNFMIIIEIVLLISCLLYLSAFGVRTIKSNIYEIGVIKSLGGSNRDISTIFIVQNLIVGIFIILISLLGMYIGANLANTLIVKSFEEILTIKVRSFKIIQFYPSIVTIDLIAAMFIIIIASVLPTRFLRKVRPIDILKAKE